MKRHLGFTLLEVVLSIGISTALLTAILLLNSPFITQFKDAFNYQRLRHTVAHSLDSMTAEVGKSRASFVDSSACYALCVLEKTTGKRVLYYWSESDLYRKSENATQALACSGGSVFAQGLDVPNSAFTQLKNLVTIKLAQIGEHGSSYRLWSAAFADQDERVEPFYDNFGCLSTTGRGWILSSGVVSWAITSSAGAVSAYAMKATLTTSLGSPVSGTAEIPVNLGRISKAFLKFKYRTEGTLSSGEDLRVDFYDGSTWSEVFRDDLQGGVSALSTTVVDLDTHTLSKNSRLRFTGSLQNQNNAWILDEVSIVAK